ncbi:putative phosphate-non-repressible acid phosphatase precursor [Podospora australis]|uniref:Phosphate-non-repressible acid phosphatase n=1 Tax=Podospora australis TaxID=1536484 RepID=A0AAN6X2B9_9PEZI|nr:putative phosphate-non-repressible acid phosphatase precursor [Podospora australis]
MKLSCGFISPFERNASGGQRTGQGETYRTDMLYHKRDSVHLPFTPSAYDFDTFTNTFEDPFSFHPASRPFSYDPTHMLGAGGGGGGAGGSNMHPGGGMNVGLGQDHHTDMYHGEEASPPEEDQLDNKLLSFGTPMPGKASLIDGSSSGSNPKLVDPAMTGELYGMFFVAEDVFGAPAENNTARPLELTCYRRNLWQCSGQVTLPRNIASYIVDDEGRKTQSQITELAASITGIESIEGKPTEIISIPWKSNNGPGAITTAGGTVTAVASNEEVNRTAGAPPLIPLDVSTAAEVEGTNKVTIPISWKRLQFKHATANNGRRKGLQQHYVVQINLLVKTKGGEYLKVAEIQSGPVIVRGRSPRNFDSRKDVPLSGDKRATEKKSSGDGTGPLSAGGLGGGPMMKHQQQQQLQQQQQQHHPLLGQDFLQRYGPLVNYSDTPTQDWSTPRPFTTPNLQSPQHPNKKMALPSPGLSRPPVPSWGSLDSSIPSNTNNYAANLNTKNNNNGFPTPTPLAKTGRSNTAPQSLPINLSLSEDERSPNRSTSSSGEGTQSPQFPMKTSSTYPLASGPNRTKSGDKTSGGFSSKQKQSSTISGGHQGGRSSSQTDTSSAAVGMTSPEETADMLYEYFPLSVDDWMPPVDAIYRPHVVHHTIVPPEVKAQQVRSKTKRYFAAE